MKCHVDVVGFDLEAKADAREFFHLLRRCLAVVYPGFSYSTADEMKETASDDIERDDDVDSGMYGELKVRDEVG